MSKRNDRRPAGRATVIRRAMAFRPARLSKGHVAMGDKNPKKKMKAAKPHPKAAPVETVMDIKRPKATAGKK